MYSFCRVFHISPKEYYETDDNLVSELLMIHTEVKKYEKEEMEKNARRNR